jgi:hypothetical protein
MSDRNRTRTYKLFIFKSCHVIFNWIQRVPILVYCLKMHIKGG